MTRRSIRGTVPVGAACLALFTAAVACQEGAGTKASGERATRAGPTAKTDVAAKPRPRRAKGGITGRMAPAWDLSKWFNVAERQKPPEVTDYRGKVVYLFFFQSW